MRRHLTLITLLAGVLTMTACSGGPPEFDGSPRPSASGHFVGAVTSSPAVPPVNQLHTWVLHIEDSDGTPIEGASVAISGDMPAHGHGLPTQPQLTEELGGGDYVIGGMKFQMGGEWYVEFQISADGITDSVRFDFTL